MAVIGRAATRTQRPLVARVGIAGRSLPVGAHTRSIAARFSRRVGRADGRHGAAQYTCRTVPRKPTPHVAHVRVQVGRDNLGRWADKVGLSRCLWNAAHRRHPFERPSLSVPPETACSASHAHRHSHMVPPGRGFTARLRTVHKPNVRPVRSRA